MLMKTQYLSTVFLNQIQGHVHNQQICQPVQQIVAELNPFEALNPLVPCQMRFVKASCIVNKNNKTIHGRLSILKIYYICYMAQLQLNYLYSTKTLFFNKLRATKNRYTTIFSILLNKPL